MSGKPGGAFPGSESPGKGIGHGFPLGEAGDVLKTLLHEEPEILIVLGSGLGGLLERLVDPVVIPFHDVPGFPAPGVVGHAGRLVAGRLGGRSILVQAGRFHFYEGHAPEVVVAPVRLAVRLGVRTAIFTNAAGGISPHFQPGAVMMLDDHINLMGRNPLAGPALEGEERFPDMSSPYDPELQTLALGLARKLKIELHRGTYAAVLGPSYETPAEIRFLSRAGADVVGMSTVPEVIAARALGVRVLAFSLVTNRAAGLGGGTLDHRDVLEVGRRAGTSLGGFLERLVEKLPPRAGR